MTAECQNKLSTFIEKIKTKKFLYWFFLYSVIVLGIILRVVFYLYDKPFWLDECKLALNVINSNNYFIPLADDQASPALFLYVSKIFYWLSPDKELGLRFLPLVFSVTSIFVFIKFAKKYLQKPETLLFAVLLFSFAYPLIYYAQDFKQYSGDVLFFLLILYSYYFLEKINSKRMMVIGAVLYSLLFYMSYASFFAEFGIFMTLLLFNPKQFRKLLYMFIPIVLSAIAFYICYKNVISIDMLISFWDTGFLTTDINSDFLLFKNIFKYSFANWIPFIIFGVSLLCAVVKDSKNKNMYPILLSLLSAMLLSYLKIYPIHSRVSLFLIPVFIIFLVKWIDFFNLKNKYIYFAALGVFVFYIMNPIIIKDYNKIFKRNFENFEDISTPLKTAVKMAKKDDIFIIAERNNALYNYYKQDFIIKNPVITERIIISEDEYIENLKSYTKGKVYYLIFAHNKHKDKRFKNIYKWAKKQKNFYCKKDRYNNAVIRFEL